MPLVRPNPRWAYETSSAIIPSPIVYNHSPLVSEVSISYGMGYGRDPPAQLVNVPGGRLGHLPRRSYRFRRLKHLGSVGLLVDGANLVPQSPRRGVRGTIYNVLTFNLQGPIMGRNTSRRTKEPIASYKRQGRIPRESAIRGREPKQRRLSWPPTYRLPVVYMPSVIQIGGKSSGS